MPPPSTQPIAASERQAEQRRLTSDSTQPAHAPTSSAQIIADCNTARRWDHPGLPCSQRGRDDRRWPRRHSHASQSSAHVRARRSSHQPADLPVEIRLSKVEPRSTARPAKASGLAARRLHFAPSELDRVEDASLRTASGRPRRPARRSDTPGFRGEAEAGADTANV